MTMAPFSEAAVTTAILSEVQGVMGLKRHPRLFRVVSLPLRPAARRLARLLVELERQVSENGWQAGAKSFLAHFVRDTRLSGADELPRRGALLVVSNHPAAYDVILLAAALPRDDLKIISSPIAVIPCLPAIASHFIFISDEAHGRMATVRAALRHLETGGALLLFPRGDAEPDPAITPGALESIKSWSASLDLFLRKAPQTRTVVSIVSGVLSPRWMHNPLVRLWKRPEQRQKVAEMFQVAQQLLRSQTHTPNPQVRFSKPITTAELRHKVSAPDGYRRGIAAQARAMLTEMAASDPSLLL